MVTLGEASGDDADVGRPGLGRGAPPAVCAVTAAAMSLQWSDEVATDATHLGADRFAVADGSDSADRSGARALAAVLRVLDRHNPASSLHRALRSSNWEIWYQDGADPGSVGVATVTIAFWSGFRFTIGHVGDSRAYLVRGGRAHQLTDDHGSRAWPTDAPIDADAEVVRVGQKPNGWSADLIRVTPEIGDRLLLCTDGLWRCAPPAALAAAVGDRPPEVGCAALESLAMFQATESASAVVVSVERAGYAAAGGDGARVLPFGLMAPTGPIADGAGGTR